MASRFKDYLNEHRSASFLQLDEEQIEEDQSVEAIAAAIVASDVDVHTDSES